ncbi:MAG: putative glycoside hydrolase [Candidatus Komeilibacteria bacterium]
MKAYYKIFLILITLAIIGWPLFGLADYQTDYPKLANYYLKWQISETEAIELAKWDLLILDMQNQFTSELSIKKIKELNPDIKILAYLTVEEMQQQHLSTNPNNPWKKLYDYVEQNNLWLVNSNQARVSFWPETWMIDLTKPQWQTWLPNFLQQEILVNQYWDGIFLDNCFSEVQWLDHDLTISDQQWQQSMIQTLQNVKAVLADQQVLVVNSSSAYADYVNGRLYENWPEVYGGNWSTNWQDYQILIDQVNAPAVVIFNSNTKNQYLPNDYQTMRYGLTSALLSKTYYSFDFGDQNHAQTWWYDEYDQYLGRAINGAQELTSNGLWRRDFEQGIVLVNSTAVEQKIRLGEEFERIRGWQDPLVNNGQIITTAKIPAADGLLLLKRIKSFTNSVYLNGSFAKVFDSSGQADRNGFFIYDHQFTGGAKIVLVDLDTNGTLEKVVADDSEVFIYDNNGDLINSFYPYTEKYNQGINMAVGDLNGDGWVEIVTGTERGGGPQIRIFNGVGKLINPGWFAYDEKFRGGVHVAVADVNGNGKMEIIAGAGFGGGPHVRIFNNQGVLVSPGFMAFEATQHSGVKVVAADLNGDGQAEIITTPAIGGEAKLNIFDLNGQLINSWQAHSTIENIDLAVADYNNDGMIEIITMYQNILNW